MSLDYEKIGQAIGKSQASTMSTLREEMAATIKQLEDATIEFNLESDKRTEQAFALQVEKIGSLTDLIDAQKAMLFELEGKQADSTTKQLEVIREEIAETTNKLDAAIKESNEINTSASLELLTGVVENSDKIKELTDQIEAQKIAYSELEEKQVAYYTEQIQSLRDDNAVITKQLEETFSEITTEGFAATNELFSSNTENIASLVEQVRAQETLCGQLEARLLEVKDGEPGLQGEAGLDRPLVEPVDISVDKPYPKSTLGNHDGGLWIAVKEATGSPEADPLAWSCILDSMTTLGVEMQDDRSYKLTVRMATGKVIEDSFSIPFVEHKGIWEEGQYQQGNIVTKGHAFWQAMQDTDQSPPGNGWKQILTAPKGAKGEQGKSIKGDKGLPGRNGRDALLPDNFVDDVIELASERKQFHDGRDSAEAITSFRGFFSWEETYKSGDVVNSGNALWVCITAGKFDSIQDSNGAFEQMLVVPTYSQEQFMLWKGAWKQSQYSTGHTVRDAGWTMVANKTTTEKPAPSTIGLERYPYQGTMTPNPQSAKSVIYGQRYFNDAEPLAVVGYKSDVILGNHYKIYLVTDIDTAPIYTLLRDYVATATGEDKFTINAQVFPQGKAFDLIGIVDEPDLTPTNFSGPWNYTNPNNTGTPGQGVVLQSNNQSDSLRVSKTDNIGPFDNRAAELATVTVGDTIVAGGSWTVISIIDNLTYVDFGVTPAQQQGNTGVQTFTFNILVATPIDTGIDVDYWLGNTNVKGLYGVDADYNDLVPDDNAYGILDILVKDIYLSDDWDVVSEGELS